MAALTVEQIDLNGLEPTLVAAAGGGDTFVNDGRTLLVINNGDASSKTATFNDTGSVAPTQAKAFDPDVDAVVSATTIAYCGPFPIARFGTNVSVTYSAVTSVTVGALRL
jgi:hypothetical protein